MEHNEESAVTAQQPAYNEDTKKEPSTPSVHSRDGSKEKEAGLYSNDVPAYTDVEGQEEEIHLNTAEDIVTHVIDLDDDPTLNPWTFRMFFLGTVAFSENAQTSYLSNLHRHGPFVLWSCSLGDLLLQASSHLCITQ
jgi:hypothetical protein